MPDPYVGEIRIFAGNFAPRGWAFCNGQLLQVAQNTALFSILGTTYGGDGETTFGLPNLQGRTPVHAGTGPGLTQWRNGERKGSETATLSLAQMGSHNHVPQGFPTSEAANPTSTRGWGTAVLYATPGTIVDMAPGLIGSAGGGAAHDNRQPYLALNFIIALIGEFP